MYIKAADLVNSAWTPLNDRWGYIWGTAGIMWTEQRQKEIETTTDKDREMARKYGAKWIGSMVADCSGLVLWAFRQNGGSIYHGSNSIWDKSLSAKGKLNGGKRADGNELKPGSAMFRTKGTDRHHIGIFVGGNLVIEAKGTQAGVVSSLVSTWDEWGEFKDVDYDGVEPDPHGKDDLMFIVKSTNGGKVKLRAKASKTCSSYEEISSGTAIDEIMDISGEWTHLRIGTHTGYMMSEFVVKNGDDPEPQPTPTPSGDNVTILLTDDEAKSVLSALDLITGKIEKAVGRG